MKNLLYILLTILVVFGGCKSKQGYKEDGDFTNQLTRQEIAGGKLTPKYYGNMDG